MADNQPDDLKQRFIADEIKGAGETLQDIINPGRLTGHEWDAAVVIEEYLHIHDSMVSAQRDGVTPQEFFARMGNGPDGKPLTEDAMRAQFRALASERFRKITDPNYDMRSESLSHDLNMMNAYLLLAEKDPISHMKLEDGQLLTGLDNSYRPDYSMLTNKDGSPVVNPETQKPYTADDMTNVQAAIEARMLRGLLDQKADVDAKDAARSAPGNTMQQWRDYYEANAKLDADVTKVLSNTTVDPGSGVFGMEHTDRFIQELGYMHINGNPYPFTARDVKRMISQSKEDEARISDFYHDIEGRDIKALTRAIHLVQDHQTGVTLPGSATQPSPSPTAKPTGKGNNVTPGN